MRRYWGATIFLSLLILVLLPGVVAGQQEGAQVRVVNVDATEFVPTLEDTGLIAELGPWIVEAACQQLARWKADGNGVQRMAINLSAKQISRGGAAEYSGRDCYPG